LGLFHYKKVLKMKLFLSLLLLATWNPYKRQGPVRVKRVVIQKVLVNNAERFTQAILYRWHPTEYPGDKVSGWVVSDWCLIKGKILPSYVDGDHLLRIPGFPSPIITGNLQYISSTKDLERQNRKKLRPQQRTSFFPEGYGASE